MASLASAAQHIQAGDTAGGSLSGTYPNPTLSVSTSPAGSNTEVQFNNNGAFGASPDIKIHSSNSALLDITDTSNPYGFGVGYGLKMAVSGHLGTPSTLYGMHFTLGGAIAGDTYGYYSDVTNASSASNYASYLSASGGARNYSIYSPAGQAHFVSSMTVSGGIFTSTLSVVNSGTTAYIAKFSTATAGPYAIDISTTGHLNSPAVIGSTVTSCGTNPAFSGSDNAGMITVGSGVTLACTLTFSKPWITAPNCVMSINTTGVTGGITTLSTTQAVFSFSATVGGGIIWYHCIGTD